MPTIYPSLRIGAARRLEIFRKEASNGKWVRPMTWRDVRFAKLTSDSGLSQGLNSGTPIWYCHSGQQFGQEWDAHDVPDVRINHTGWFTDMDGYEKSVGIVARLPHGRFIVGYRWTSNDERVYFADIYTDKSDAAHAADSHAESFAESAREDDEMFQQARKLEEENEDALTRLRECLVLRHKNCMDYVRDEISELLETLRTNRARLATEFKDWT